MGLFKGAHYSASLNSELLAAFTPGASPLFLLEMTPTSSLDSSSLYTSTAKSCSPLLMQHPHFYPRLQISYPPSTHFVSFLSASSPPPLLAVSLHLLLPLPPWTPSGFFDEMLGVSKQGALNSYFFFHLIPLTLFVSRNLTLTDLPLSGSLDSLLCDLIAPTSGLALSFLMPRTLAAASSFSSGMACLSLNFLPPLSLRLLTPTLIM